MRLTVYGRPMNEIKMNTTPMKNVINLVAKSCSRSSSTNFQHSSLKKSRDKSVQSIFSPASLHLVTSLRIKQLLSADNVEKFTSTLTNKYGLKCRTEKVLRKRTYSNQKVARCLFSKDDEAKKASVPSSKHWSKQNLPLIDTPQQKNIPSTDEVKKIFEGRILGRGSFGTVVKGIYKRKEVAIKLIHYSQKKNVYYSLKKEENALKLTHPNIIQVFKITNLSELSIGCVFMEYYAHRTLETVLIDLIPFPIKLKYLSEIASALEYCHNQSILHLDVKPSNILVGLTNNVSKLCDFGSSKQLENVTQSSSSPKGTLKYCAPEILKSEEISDKSDVYSYGVTMWQVLYQETPYHTEDIHVVIYKVVKQRYRPGNLKSQPPLSNSGLERIYQACWEEKPANRPSMSVISAKLGEIKLRF